MSFDMFDANNVSEHQDNWDKLVLPLNYSYNAQVHRSTGPTPFYLMILWVYRTRFTCIVRVGLVV